jgi:hypothetical protein
VSYDKGVTAGGGCTNLRQARAAQFSGDQRCSVPKN